MQNKVVQKKITILRSLKLEFGISGKLASLDWTVFIIHGQQSSSQKRLSDHNLLDCSVRPCARGGKEGDGGRVQSTLVARGKIWVDRLIGCQGNGRQHRSELVICSAGMKEVCGGGGAEGGMRETCRHAGS